MIPHTKPSNKIFIIEVNKLSIYLIRKQKKHKLNFLICFLAWQTILRDYSVSDCPDFARLMLGCYWLVKNGNLSNLSIEKISIFIHFLTACVRQMLEVMFVKNRSNQSFLCSTNYTVRYLYSLGVICTLLCVVQ